MSGIVLAEIPVQLFADMWERVWMYTASVFGGCALAPGLKGSAAPDWRSHQHTGESDRSGHALRRYRNCQARDSRCR